MKLKRCMVNFGQLWLWPRNHLTIGRSKAIIMTTEKTVINLHALQVFFFFFFPFLVAAALVLSTTWNGLFFNRVNEVRTCRVWLMQEGAKTKMIIGVPSAKQTKWNFHIWGSDDNTSPRQKASHYLPLHENNSCQASENALRLFCTAWPTWNNRLNFAESSILEWFSNDCRKTKTKAIAPTNHSRSRQRDEPIAIPSNHL